MKGFVFHGPGQSAWEEVPDPAVQEPTTQAPQKPPAPPREGG